jgi:nucleoside phosphorylase
MAGPLLILIEGTDELLPVAKGIGAKRIDGSIYHWRAEAQGEMPETFISCTGVGTRRSYDCTREQIAKCKPGLIVSAGTFGALVEGVNLTEWLCIARSRMLGDRIENRAFKQDLNGGERSGRHVTKLTEGLKAVGGKPIDGLLICVGDVPLFHEEEKSALAKANGAVGVDMETFGIARASEEAGIPWVVARVCVDTPKIPLPDFGALSPVTGPPYYGRLFWWIVTHPVSCVPKLYGLWKLVNVYGRQLAEIIKRGYLRP